MKKTAYLGDIADITTGYPFRSGIADDPSGTVRVIQMREAFPPATVDWNAAARVVMEKNMEQYLLRAGDILFVMRGGNYYSVYAETVPCPALASPHFFRVRLLGNQGISPAFLAWQLNQAPVQRFYNSMEAGSAQKSLRTADFAELPIVLLPPERQKQILKAVDCIYKEIAALQAGIANREVLLTVVGAKELA